MTTKTAEITVTNESTKSAATKAKEHVEGLQSYVTTPVANTMNYPKLATAIIGSYVVLEVVHHYLLGSIVAPYLTSIGVGATASMAIFYGTLAISALGVSYLIYKMFFKPKTVIRQIN